MPRLELPPLTASGSFLPEETSGVSTAARSLPGQETTGPKYRNVMPREALVTDPQQYVKLLMAVLQHPVLQQVFATRTPEAPETTRPFSQIGGSIGRFGGFPSMSEVLRMMQVPGMQAGTQATKPESTLDLQNLLKGVATQRATARPKAPKIKPPKPAAPPTGKPKKPRKRGGPQE